MSRAARLDAWIGKTLFVPLIIRCCQRLKISQYQFGRGCWFAAAMIGFYFASGGVQVFYGVLALIMCLYAGLAPANHADSSWRWFRLLILGGLVLSLPIVLAGEFWRGFYQTLALFAEYACTIKTIPPLETKEVKRGKRVSEQSA